VGGFFFSSREGVKGDFRGYKRGTGARLGRGGAYQRQWRVAELPSECSALLYAISPSIGSQILFEMGQALALSSSFAADCGLALWLKVSFNTACISCSA